MTRRVLEARVGGDRDHAVHRLVQVPLEELGLRLGDLDEDLERAPARLLLARRERLRDRLQHQRHELLEVVARVGGLEGEQKGGEPLEASDAHGHGLVGLQRAAEDLE